MKIIDYKNYEDKKRIACSAYEVCQQASFPVDYQDVYEHLFGQENLVLKFLLNDQNNLSGFGVFENYKLEDSNSFLTMMYLSGMVIHPQMQGKNVSQEIIRSAYQQAKTDLIALRTQNIAMAKSLLNLYSDNLFEMPIKRNPKALNYLRKAIPFQTIEENGVIRNCYSNQLYENLEAIKDNFGITLQSKDALAVVIEPRNQKKLSRFKEV